MRPIFTLTKNIFSLFTARAIDILCRLVVIAIVTRYLGVEEYGEYAFAGTFVVFFVLLTNMGVEEILTREIAKSPGDEGRMLSGAMSIRLVLIPLTTAAYLAVAFSMNVSGMVIKAICISVFAQIFLSFINLFFSVFRGMEKMEYEPAVGLLINIMLVPAIVVIARFDLGFLSIFHANLLAHVLAATVLFFFITWKLKDHILRLNLTLGRQLLLSGYPLGISALLLAASFHVDIFVLRFLRDASEVALFQLPYQIIFRLLIIPMSLVSAVFPALSRLAKATGNEKTELRDPVTQGYRLLLIISMLTCLLLTNLSNEIILIMGGPHFSGAVISLQILAWSTIFLFGDFLQSMTLVALNRQRLLVIQNIASLALNLFLDLVLIPFYGYIGACVATLVAFIIRFVIGLAFVDRSLGGISIYPTVFKIAVSGSAAAVFMLLFSGWNAFFSSFGGVLVFLLVIVMTKSLSFSELRVFSQMMRP